jgi:DegV family protein with EDD domain
MPKIHIVTDSCASFANSHFVEQSPITVVPNTVTIAGGTYREGIDLKAEDTLKLIAKNYNTPVVIKAPSVADYTKVYSRFIRTHDAIISIHASREIYESWQNAKIAAEQMMGRCQIIVIDSQSLCAAQGLLVKVATKAASELTKTDDIVRTIRSAVDRIYSVYYVDSLNFLSHNKLLSWSHQTLGTMLGIKPFITMEEGKLTIIEKVRTRNQAVDRLVDFASEFINIEDKSIVHNKLAITDSTRMLQDRLSSAFPGQYFPYSVYNASLAALIGTDATGVVILERNMDSENGYY